MEQRFGPIVDATLIRESVVTDDDSRRKVIEAVARDYNELSRLADSSAAIKNLVINHGIKRMNGQAKGVSWKQVLGLARQFARA